MLEAGAKRRVVWVALCAFALMAGIVVSAVVGRGASGDRDALGPRGVGPAGGLGLGSTPGAPVAPPTRRDAPELPPECRADPARPPHIVVDLPGFALDLGGVRQGEVIERDIPFRNDGTGDLCITDVETGCGCVQAKLVGKNRLAPGESGAVHVSVDTTGREGSQSKDVKLFTNDPEQRVATVMVSLEVRLGVIAEGGHLYFGRRSVGQPGTGTIRLKSPRDAPEWTVTGVRGAKIAYEFSVRPVEPGDPRHRTYELTVVHPALDKPGFQEDQIKIATSHPERPEVVVRGQMLAVPKYYTGPERVSFGFVGGTAPTVTRRVLVFPGDGTSEFVVTGAEIEGEGFVCEPPLRTKGGWSVAVRYDGAPRAKGVAVEATLLLRIDDADLPLLRVPLSGTVRDT